MSGVPAPATLPRNRPNNPEDHYGDYALPDREPQDRRLVRLLRTGMALLMGLIGGSQQLCAADAWGGSVSVTSDYLVRGISRSNDRPALQIDLHYLNKSGFLGGG